MTCSIGFRAASRAEFAREVLQRTLDAVADAESAEAVSPGVPYRDPRQAPTATPARIPEAMQAFAVDAVQRLVGDAQAIACSLGEWLSEPKPQVWFDEGAPLAPQSGVRLDNRSRMLWDDWHVFINGESFRAGGRDARLMRELADTRRLGAAQRARLGPDAAALLADWAVAGWLHAEDEFPTVEPADDDRPTR
jgi:50S ribosomal protein L16 3-hydroxylase